MHKQGSIVLVPFPFTDLTSAKVRPALVVSSFKPEKPDVIVAFITSNLELADEYCTAIKPDADNNLKVPSLVRFDKLATLDKRIILGAIGNVSDSWLLKNKKTALSVFEW